MSGRCGDFCWWVDGEFCQMWSAIRPSFHWWYLSSWACSIHLLCWVVSSHLHRWLQDSKKHITACWQMSSYFCSRFHGFLLRFRCFFGTLEVSTPHTTQLLTDKKWDSFTGSFSRSTDMSCCLRSAFHFFCIQFWRAAFRRCLLFQSWRRTLQIQAVIHLGESQMLRCVGYAAGCPKFHWITTACAAGQTRILKQSLLLWVMCLIGCRTRHPNVELSNLLANLNAF